MTILSRHRPAPVREHVGARRASTKATQASSRILLLLALPALALYTFVVLIPSAQGVGYAFTDWNGLTSDFAFVGFRNLQRVFTDPVSAAALGNTLVIAFVFTLVQNTIGILLALAVTSRIKSRYVLRVAFFLPAILTPLVVAYLWKFLLAPNGTINGVLAVFGIDAQPWLGEPDLALGAIIAVLIWQYVGYSMIIFVAGLEGVPVELTEASMMDGAGPVRRFFSVTLPMIAPAMTINLVLSMLAGLKLFDQVFALTGGGPGGSTHTLSTLLYQQAFSYGEVGRGVAMALVLTVLVAVITGIQYGVLSRREVRA